MSYNFNDLPQKRENEVFITNFSTGNKKCVGWCTARTVSTAYSSNGRTIKGMSAVFADREEVRAKLGDKVLSEMEAI